MNRAEILAAADAATNGQRDAQYGTPEDNFERIATLWNAHVSIIAGANANVQFSAEDVAWMLMQVKQARAVHSFNADNYVDAAGYAACGGEIAARWSEE